MKKKEILRVIGFIVVFILLFFKVSERIFKRDTPVIDYAYNHAPRESIDLLVVGSSHSYCSFNTKILDNYLNINSYNFSEGSIALDGLYYSIVELLKTQKPKVVVIEGYSLIIRKFGADRNYSNTRLLLDSMEPSLNKIKMTRENLPDKERFLAFFTTTSYHERWKEGKKLKYIRNKEAPDYKGFTGYNYDYIRGILNYDVYEKNHLKEYNEKIDERPLELLEKLAIKLNAEGIKLVIAFAPTVPNEIALQKKYSLKTNERFIEITNKYNVGVINFDSEEKLEKIHFLDDGHISLAGSDIITENLALAIKEEYNKHSNENKKELEDRSAEYYFYNKKAERNDGVFTSYPVEIKLETGLKIVEVNKWKKDNEKYDLYLKISSENSPYDYIFNGEKESRITIEGQEIIFKESQKEEKGVKYRLYPKYYIRRLKGEHYIYVKDF